LSRSAITKVQAAIIALIVIVAAIVVVVITTLPTPTPPPGPATIKGKVIDELTGLPVAGATVRCDGYMTSTATDGTYSLSIKVGNYTLTVSKEKYETEKLTVSISEEKEYTFDINLKRALIVAEVKIGLLYPFTGAAGAFGEEAKRVYELIVEEINKKGIISLGGAKIKLIYADTESMPDPGVAAAERLITVDKVHLIMGCVQSGVAVPTTAVAEKYGVPYYVVEPVADIITERGFKWVFRHRAKASYYGRDMWMPGGIIAYLEQVWGIKVKTFVHLFEDTEFARSTENALKAYHDLYRPDVEYISICHPYPAVSLDVEISKIKAIDPDILLMTNYPPGGMLAIDTMIKLGYNPKMLIGFCSAVNPAFIEYCGKKLLGFIACDTWSSGCTMPGATILGKTLDEWERLHFERYGLPLTTVGVECLSAMSVVYEILEKVGSVEPEALREGFRTIKTTHHFLPFETVEFDESGQNPNARNNPGVYMWDKNLNKVRFFSIWPPEVAVPGIEKYLKYPAPSWEEREKDYVWPP